MAGEIMDEYAAVYYAKDQILKFWWKPGEMMTEIACDVDHALEILTRDATIKQPMVVIWDTAIH